jgi:hypothetical protein
VEIISIPSRPARLRFNDRFLSLGMGSKLKLEFLSGVDWKRFERVGNFLASFQGGLEVNANRLLQLYRGWSCKTLPVRGCGVFLGASTVAFPVISRALLWAGRELPGGVEKLPPFSWTFCHSFKQYGARTHCERSKHF